MHCLGCGADAEPTRRNGRIDRVGAAEVEVFVAEVFVDEVQFEEVVFRVLEAHVKVAELATGGESLATRGRREVVIDESKTGRDAVCPGVVRIERDSITRGVVAMVLRD